MHSGNLSLLALSNMWLQIQMYFYNIAALHLYSKSWFIFTGVADLLQAINSLKNELLYEYFSRILDTIVTHLFWGSALGGCFGIKSFKNLSYKTIHSGYFHRRENYRYISHSIQVYKTTSNILNNLVYTHFQCLLYYKITVKQPQHIGIEIVFFRIIWTILCYIEAANKDVF